MTMFLVTENRGAKKLHRSTCKKASANPAAVATDDYQAGTPATCCKPKPVESVPAAKPAKPAKAKAPAARKPTPQDKPVDRVLDSALRKDAKRRAADAAPELAPEGPERLAAAKAEHKAAAAAKRAGRKLPATPNLDALNEANAAGRPKAKRERKPRQRTEVTVRLVRGQFMDDLKPMPDSQNKLSSVAYYHTRGVKAWNELDESLPRCTTETLRSLLVHHGVTDPETTTWGPVMLPNGVWLGAVAK